MLTYYIIALDGGAMVPISEETLEKAWSGSIMPQNVREAIEVALDYMSEKEENNKPSTASVEAVARIDAMGVQPERSDTFHYQAAGYSQGWHAAIAAYRQGIRKLASLTPAPAQGDK